MKINATLTIIALVLLVPVTGAACFTAGGELSARKVRRDAIVVDAAHYDMHTGKFAWGKAPATMSVPTFEEYSEQEKSKKKALPTLKFSIPSPPSPKK